MTCPKCNRAMVRGTWTKTYPGGEKPTRKGVVFHCRTCGRIKSGGVE